MHLRRLSPLAVLLAAGLATAGASDPPTADHAVAAAPPRAWFGVFFGDAVDGGVQVLEVVPNGPAAQAGLASGDLVIRVDGRDVAARDDLARALEGRLPGEALALTILRAGQPKEARVVLGALPGPGWRLPRAPAPPRLSAPASEEALSAAGVLGIGVGEIPSELRKHFGGPAESGLLILRVASGGAAAGALRVGDLLVTVAGHGVATEADLDRAVLGLGTGTLALSGVRGRAAFTAEVPLRLKSPEERAREDRARALEAAIRRIEAQLAELKRQLAALPADP